MTKYSLKCLRFCRIFHKEWGAQIIAFLNVTLNRWIRPMNGFQQSINRSFKSLISGCERTLILLKSVSLALKWRRVKMHNWHQEHWCLLLRSKILKALIIPVKYHLSFVAIKEQYYQMNLLVKKSKFILFPSWVHVWSLWLNDFFFREAQRPYFGRLF